MHFQAFHSCLGVELSPSSSWNGPTNSSDTSPHQCPTSSVWVRAELYAQYDPSSWFIQSYSTVICIMGTVYWWLGLSPTFLDNGWEHWTPYTFESVAALWQAFYMFNTLQSLLGLFSCPLWLTQRRCIIILHTRCGLWTFFSHISLSLNSSSSPKMFKSNTLQFGVRKCEEKLHDGHKTSLA